MALNLNTLRKLKRAAGIFTEKIANLIKKIAKRIAIILVAAAIVILIYLIIILIFTVTSSKELRGTCIEADEFGQKRNTIPAKPIRDSDYLTESSTYSHEKFMERVRQTDLKLSLTGEPITINITGKWTPWFGSLSDDDRKKIGLDDNFFCSLEKHKITGSYSFSNVADENELYYIRNYYSGIKESMILTPSGNRTVSIKGIEEVPERQKDCWITRGAGMYLAAYGINGKTEPSAFHHVIASKMICNEVYWFSGQTKNDNYVVTSYKVGDEDYSYKLKDFKKNYFSASYYENPDDPNTDLNDEDMTILVQSRGQIIYNIDVHENLLIKKNVKNYGLIIANSMAKFAQACYQTSKDISGASSRTYKSYFQYGPKVLYRNIEGLQNIKYDYGEKIQMIIVDKYYKDNSGQYQIEIVSGIELDDSGGVEAKLQEIEFYLLGTPHVGNKATDRTDGMVARIFHNVLSSDFVLFVRASMALFIAIYGFRVIFGFKKNKNDKSVINRRDLMMSMLKLSIVTVITSPNAFSFFNSTIMSFTINGTIGIIDMIAGIFENSFMDNTIALVGGLKYASNIPSLSRNFAIVDEIIAFFVDDALFSKIFSFAFLTGMNFFFGLIVSIAILVILLLYLLKLLQAIIPFIFVLIQFTLVLPLAPLFILFGLFEQTSVFMKNWMKFIFSKCLELISFFTAFYFCTTIIDNYITMLLSFRVCFRGLGDLLFPKVDDEVAVDGVKDFFEFNWLKELIKKILNNFIAIIREGMPENFFMYYMVN
ncbi:MAG: type IV secretion system protein, partial [Rickettsiales bacterium]|nr:type IV secretion system protein [Rickettsiales bacterium]